MTKINPDKLKSYTLFLRKDQIFALKEIFRDKGVPSSESIRRAIDKYLEETIPGDAR